MAVVELKKISYYEALLRECAEEAFVRHVAEKYHYAGEETQMLLQIAQEVHRAILQKGSLCSAVVHSLTPRHQEMEQASANGSVEQTEGPHGNAGGTVTACVLTLGEQVDTLQERYEEKGDLAAAYMVEAFCNEILMKCYAVYNQMLAQTTDYHVARLHFPGSEDAYPLPIVRDVIQRLHAPVKCLHSFCMIPKKSVVFLAELTTDEAAVCEGICSTCNRKDCENR